VKRSPKPVESGEGVPSRRDVLRPLELLILAAAIGIFTGLVVFLATREWILAAIFFGVVFIVSLVGLAMLALAVSPVDPKLPGHDDDQAAGH
jgi:hypothetical protein